MDPIAEEPEYHCPGEPAAISRAVHLARLADGYSACRGCPKRGDTAGLPRGAVRRLDSRPAPGESDGFDEEGAGGNLHEGFNAALVGRLAAAFGLVLRAEPNRAAANPVLVAAGDGRPMTEELFAAAVERLRWAACDVVELGPATAPALAWTIAHRQADGGLYLGNPRGAAHSAALRFFADRGRPISSGPALDALRQTLQNRPARPERRFGAALRRPEATDYFERFADAFHGLRPLRFSLATSCPPFADGLAALLERTACRMVRSTDPAGPPAERANSGGHFAVSVDDDGQSCRLWDQRGRPIPFSLLVRLVARTLAASSPTGGVAAVDGAVDQHVAAESEAAGLRIVRCGGLRGDLHEAMRSHRALLGLDRAGRIWYRTDDFVAADALPTLVILLRTLSGDSRPLSEVLDEPVPGH